MGKKTNTHSFNMIMVVLMAIIVITPYLSRTVPSIIRLLLFIIWTIDVFSHSRNNSILTEGFGLARWLIILLCWQFILSLVGYSSLKPTNIIMRIPVYCIPIIGMYSVNHYSYREIKTLFSLLLIIVLVNLIDNVRLEIISPGFFDAFKRSDESFAVTNGGSTSFVCSILAVIPILYLRYTNININIKTKKIYYLVYMVLSVYYIIFINSRATVLFILIFYIIMLMFERRTARFEGGRGIRSFFLIFLLIIIIIAFIPSLEFLARILPDRLSFRILDVVDSINSRQIDDSGEGSLYSRWYLATISINTWLSSPMHIIMGKGEDVALSGSFVDLVRLGIGQHSEFADFLAKYGLIGAFLLYKSLSSMIKYILSLCNDYLMKREVLVMLLGFLLMSIFNNSLIDNYLTVLFIILPLSIIVTQKEKMI